MQKQIETNEALFKQLNQIKKVTTYEPSLFGDTVPPRYTEYWPLNDLRNMIGTEGIPTNKIPNWRNLYETINKVTPRYLIENLGNDTTKWWNDQIHKDKSDGTELSTYSGWAVAKVVGQYRDTSFIQSYFLWPNTSFPEVDAFSDKIARSQKRAELKQANNMIKSIVSKAKANHEDFFNMIYTELFQNALSSDSMQNKRPFADHMNIPLLVLYTKTLYQIASRWGNSIVQEPETLYHIAAQEMKNLRLNIPGGCPEKYLVNSDATRILSEVDKREQEFINQNTQVYSK